MRISDWSSDVCSSDLTAGPAGSHCQAEIARVRRQATASSHTLRTAHESSLLYRSADLCLGGRALHPARWRPHAKGSSDRTISHCGAPFTHHKRNLLGRRCRHPGRSEEHTSELQSLMRISYAVFCLKKKITKQHSHNTNTTQ